MKLPLIGGYLQSWLSEIGLFLSWNSELKWTHKFGIELRKTVKEAFDLDRMNGNTLWAAGITKEMKNVRVAFKILADDESVPIG